MADKKISQLPAATTPLAGTEVLPIVQSGTTVKVSVDNLTAGKPVSCSSLTVNAGNLIIGTSGKGIDFSATSDGSGTMTSELLNDYEEGTWTPVIAIDGTGSITATVSGSYTKIGRFVFCTFQINVTDVSSPNGSLYINGLPYAAKTGAAYGSVTINAFFGLVAGKTMLGGYVQSGSSGFVPTGTAGSQTTVDNPIAAGNMQANSFLAGTVTYIV